MYSIVLYNGTKSLSKIIFHLLSLIRLRHGFNYHVAAHLFKQQWILHCDIYESKGILYSKINIQCIVFIPNFFSVLSILFDSIVIVEFMRSQIPYAMKGLIFGPLFTSFSTIFLAPGLALIAVFLQHYTTWTTETCSQLWIVVYA